MNWSVVSTVAEPAQLVCAFVAHHLHLGAARVHLFLDRPDESTQHLLSGVEGVALTVCDEAYWRERGGRPELVTERQKINAQSVYDSGDTEWLLHLDADEFLYHSAGLIEAMQHADPSCAELRVGVRERVRISGDRRSDIFAGCFRIPAERPESFYRSIYGEEAAGFLHKGLKAYSHFKTLYRRGRGLALGIHAARNGREVKSHPASVPGRPLLHFDGLTPLSWVQKMYQKLLIEDYRNKPNPARRAQLIRFERHAREPRAICAIFQAIDILDDAQKQALQREGLIDCRPFSPRPALEAILTGVDFDFSQGAFDACIDMAPEIGALKAGGTA